MALNSNIAMYFKKSTTPVSIVVIDNQSEVPLHSHSFYELVVIVSGKGVHCTEQEEYPVESGDIFLIKKGETHGYRNTQNLELINILFLPERMPVPPLDMLYLPGYHAFFSLEPNLRAKDKFSTHLKLSKQELYHVLSIIEEIKHELQEDVPGNEYMTVSLFMRIQCFIARNFFCEKRKKYLHNTTLQKVAMLISYMQTHYSKKISLSELTKKANMSVSSCHRAFVTATGSSPIKYLLRLRTAKAAELLTLYPEKDITEIAFLTGFNDSNYFTRQFKKILGISPMQYKKISELAKPQANGYRTS